MHFILNLLLSSSLSLAGGRVSGQVQSEVKDGTFKARVKEGFHLNIKAPNAVIIDGAQIKPTQISSRDVEFKALPNNFTHGQANLYVCDDAVTFCDTVVFDLKTGHEIDLANKVPENSKTAKKVSKTKGLPNKNGFYEDDFNQALNEAKREKKLLLVDFSARWCPSCVRLEREIFGTKEFKKLADDFVKLKIDVDRFENSVIAEKFSVKEIPSLLIITPEQEEVDRIKDFQPIERLAQFFSSVKEDPLSLRELSEKARAKDPAVLMRLGNRLLAAGRAGEALETFRLIKPAPPELLTAEVQAYPKDAKVLKKAIETEPTSLRSIAWRGALAEQTTRFDDKLKLRKEGISLADELLKDPEKLKKSLQTEDAGEFTSFEPFLVAISRAELVESSDGSADEIEETWKKAAKVATDLKIPVQNVGMSMRHLIVLIKAKEYRQGNQLVSRLLKVDPNNPELQRRRLRILYELKDFDGAVALGKKVVKNSYGRNEFWAAETTAKAYAQSGKKKEALAFIESYLSRPEMDWSSLKETRQTLEALKKKLLDTP